MVVRWVSAAIVEAERKFRRVQGWRDIEKLVTALKAIDTSPVGPACFADADYGDATITNPRVVDDTPGQIFFTAV